MIKLLRLIFLAAALVLAVPAANAVKARPDAFTVTTDDGRQLRVRLVGDEHFHYYETDDGYPLLRDNNNFYYASVTDGGKLVCSAMKALSAEERSSEAIAFLAQVDRGKVIEAMPRRKSQSTAKAAGDGESDTRYGLYPGAAFPTTGEQKALVIRVEYADVAFSTPDAGVRFSDMLNAEGYDTDGASGSARDYFIHSSGGRFIPQFDVYGPVLLSRDRSYYGSNDFWGNDSNPHEMVIEACQLLDDEVDFTEYDRDGDGIIDNVFVFYAGRGEATNGGSDTVWPHSSKITDWLPDEEQRFDGVLLDSYACTNEWTGSRTCGIGTFCHEFSHVLGLPDLYSTSYSSAFTPGTWSLMDTGSYNNDELTPAGYTVFERYALGWLDPFTVAPGSGEITLRPISENEGIIINTPEATEFYLLENRQREGWDAYIPGHGMLVWHIDYIERVWRNNTVNNSSRHQYVDIIEADDVLSERTRSADTFPGTGNVTMLSDDTTPSLTPWTKKRLDIAITGIDETDDGLITFSITDNPEQNSSAEIAEADRPDFTVDGLTVNVGCEHQADISIVAATGTTLVATRAATLSFRLPAAGLYMITIDGKVRKIMAR